MARTPGRKASSSRKARSAPARKTPKLTPLRDLSPDYRRRLEAAAKRQGVTVTQLRREGAGAARGHKPPPGQTEAGARRAKERARIAAYLAEQSRRSGRPVGELSDILVPKIAAHGMAWFGKLERFVDSKHVQYVAGRSKPLGANLADWSEDFDDLDDEFFYYH
jgi:hypothetical protein